MWTSATLCTDASADPGWRELHGEEVEVLGSTTYRHPSGTIYLADVLLIRDGTLMTLPAPYVINPRNHRLDHAR